MISKDERLRFSPPYVGFLILRKLGRIKERKIIFDELVSEVKKELGTISYRQLMFGLVFLRQSQVIDFAEPYIYTKNK